MLRVKPAPESLQEEEQVHLGMGCQAWSERTGWVVGKDSGEPRVGRDHQPPHMAAQFYPLGSKQVVVKGPEALAGVVAAVGASHEVLQHQPYVYEADVVIGRQVALEEKRPGLRHTPQALGPLLATPWVPV